MTGERGRDKDQFPFRAGSIRRAIESARAFGTVEGRPTLAQGSRPFTPKNEDRPFYPGAFSIGTAPPTPALSPFGGDTSFSFGRDTSNGFDLSFSSSRGTSPPTQSLVTTPREEQAGATDVPHTPHPPRQRPPAVGTSPRTGERSPPPAVVCEEAARVSHPFWDRLAALSSKLDEKYIDELVSLFEDPATPKILGHKTGPQSGSSRGKTPPREDPSVVDKRLRQLARNLAGLQQAEADCTLTNATDRSRASTGVKVARIVMRAIPGGKAYVNQLHYLYKLSKHRVNDALLQVPAVFELLLEALESTVSSPDALIFAAGSLKNITESPNATGPAKTKSKGGSPALQLCTERDVGVLVRVMGRTLDALVQGGNTSNASCVHTLVQLTGWLRNLCEARAPKGSNAAGPVLLAQQGIVPLVLRLLREQSAFKDLVFNASRILYKLSLNYECRQSFNEDPLCVPLLLGVCRTYATLTPITERLLFTLGNLTHTSHENRVAALRADCLPLLEDLCRRYVENDLTLPPGERATPFLTDADSGSRSGSNSDVANEESLTEGPQYLATDADSSAPDARPSRLQDGALELTAREQNEYTLIRLVRLIGNLCNSADCGSQLCHSGVIADTLVTLLKRKSIARSEELVLNVISCVTNLSAYSNSDVSNRFDDLLQSIGLYVLHDNPDVVMESVRALNNLSQPEAAREWLRQRRVDEALLMLVDHSDPRVVEAVCGALVNIAGDPRHHPAFRQPDAVPRLLDLLAEFTDFAREEDLETIHRLLKVFYNLVAGNLFGPATTAEVGRLHELVADLFPNLERALPEAGEVAGCLLQLLGDRPRPREQRHVATATAGAISKPKPRAKGKGTGLVLRKPVAAKSPAAVATDLEEITAAGEGP